MKTNYSTNGLKGNSGLLALGLSLVLAACSKTESSYSLLPDSQEFKQSTAFAQRKIDILFVIDNSGSMNSSQTNLGNNMTSFINRFATLGFDYRIAVTTTEAWLGDPYFNSIAANTTVKAYYPSTQNNDRLRAGCATGGGNLCLGTTPFTIMDPSNTTTANFQKFITQGVAGKGDERAFSSFVAALKNPENAVYEFPRAGSFLSIIILSDEDDYSGDSDYGSSIVVNRNYNAAAPLLQPTSYYVDWLTTFMKGAANFSVSAIYADTAQCVTQLGNSGQAIGVRYAQIVDQTKGIKGSLCSNFGDTLSQINANVLTLTSTFVLDREPNPDTIVVKVNGLLVAHNEANGWSYLVDQNAVQFRGDAIPEQGASINIDFDPVRAKN